ncbi:uncharacterized protein LOC126671907 [Mercurialis annua]|uniref:uncharacterized protein LOC126671907 n=1 Tax=Mercurialis annua TaxID=3986 RepID=UPI00215EBE83|nr:uncharacterized protein LOC126671907 [Mercurialis annua]
MESKNREQCKIRKRGNSSSSSSSVVQKYRFKRAILVGKRGGSSTPVPTWKTATKSPALSSSMPNAEPPPSQTKEASVSARKLAATLWEINKIPAPNGLHLVGDTKELKSREKVAKYPHLSDPSYTPTSEKMDRSSRAQNASFMEIEGHNAKGRTRRECLKDVSNGLTASKELLKVLYRIWGVDEQHSSAVSLVSALRVEINRARVQVDQLIKDERSNRNEIECIVKHFEEEKAAWKSKERDRIRNAIACISEELQVEKKLRKQTERLNKKLGMEVADVKASLSSALKQVESEKRAKEILEQVCDELARGIGQDRAEVEELKRESAKVKDEVEKEREMLQLADVLREERVQMKLSEARYHFEEKNEAVEMLKHELESYLQQKVGEGEKGGGSPNYERIKELEAYLKEIRQGSCPRIETEENEGVAENGHAHDEDESDNSDLHSIELNMDNNSKIYKWSYACDDGVASDRDLKGRKSISDNIQWGSICLQRGNSYSVDGPDSDFISKNQEILKSSHRERSAELDSHSQTQDHELDGIMQYKSVINSLRDHILSGARRQPILSFASPTRPWQDSGSEVSDSSPVLQGDSLKPRVMGTKGERRSLTSSRH